MPNDLPGHYQHGFDHQICAPESRASLYLCGGNESTFGMTLKLPSPDAGSAEESGAALLPEDAVSEDPTAFDGAFRPDAVTFYVRTDNKHADAGHFILGESNEVNKRVAQFQFTRDGRMGLLGTGGTTHGATGYEPNRWYLIELRFDWDIKQVAFYVDHQLQQRSIPFRRETSCFIGACALGNRDRCTTWFDSIKFVRETKLCKTELCAHAGRADAWIGPLRHESATAGCLLRVEDSAGNVGEEFGPFFPLSSTEGAQRVAINATALSEFVALLDDADSADVVFVVEGRPQHAHRCILTARCEAFRLMFNSPMREGTGGREGDAAGGAGTRAGRTEVAIEEASHAAFRCMLLYVYGGAVHVPEEFAVELLGLADRFLLGGLKQLCGFTLARMVAVDTVALIIQAAERWDAPKSALKALCLDFILSHYEACVSHPVFEELQSSPQLLLEITRAATKIVVPDRTHALTAASGRLIELGAGGSSGRKRRRDS